MDVKLLHLIEKEFFEICTQVTTLSSLKYCQYFSIQSDKVDGIPQGTPTIADYLNKYAETMSVDALTQLPTISEVGLLRSASGNDSDDIEKALLLPDFRDELTSLSSKHEEISQKSRNQRWYVSFWITYSMRCNLLILYAKTFHDNIAVISIAVYLSYISSAISSLGYGIIDDRWRIDYLLIIASILDVIAYWMEATAHSISCISNWIFNLCSTIYSYCLCI